jgi:hypothetical protein
LRERALQDNVSYDKLINLGVAKEQSVLGAEQLEKASGQGSSSKIKIEEEVRKLRMENKKLKAKPKGPCSRCGNQSGCTGKKCPANGQKCGKCHKMNHYAKMCFSKKKGTFGQISSAEESDSDKSCARITVAKLDSKSILAKISVTGQKEGAVLVNVYLATDTGISKTVLNRTDWPVTLILARMLFESSLATVILAQLLSESDSSALEIWPKVPFFFEKHILA